MVRDQLAADQAAAMRARDEARLRTVRSLRAAIQTAEIAARSADSTGLDEPAVLAVIAKQAKQRRDSIEQFEAAGREDLASREREELEIIESYLPSQLSDEDLERELRSVIAEVGATDASGLGKVMGPAMSRLKGRADGKRVQEAARRLLAN